MLGVDRFSRTHRMADAVGVWIGAVDIAHGEGKFATAQRARALDKTGEAAPAAFVPAQTIQGEKK